MGVASGDSREARRDATRRRILDAAWSLSREHGLGGWSLRDLGAAVGMRAPSLYEYVAGKGALYDALYADGYTALLERIRAAEPPDEQLDRLRFAAHLYVDFCTEDPARCQLLFLRPVPGFEPSPASYALAVQVRDALAEVLAGAGHGSDEEVDLWTAVLTGLATQQTSNDPGGDRWTRLVDRAVDRFLT